MREVSFNWDGAVVRLTPSLELLQRIALDLRTKTEGQATTVSLAYQCVNGGLEPFFLGIPLHHFLVAGLGDKAPTATEAVQRLLSDLPDAMSFRLAYVEAILPALSEGKGRAAQSVPAAAGSRKTGTAKRSTSKASTS